MGAMHGEAKMTRKYVDTEIANADDGRVDLVTAETETLVSETYVPTGAQSRCLFGEGARQEMSSLTYEDLWLAVDLADMLQKCEWGNGGSMQI